jgi:hypothetical protein
MQIFSEDRVPSVDEGTTISSTLPLRREESSPSQENSDARLLFYNHH